MNQVRATLAGRIVLIGSSAPELGGLRVTPGSPATPSVLIQAEAVDAMLRGDVPVRPSWAEFAEPIGALVLGLLCLLLAVRLRPALAVSLAVLVCLAWTGAAVAAVPRFCCWSIRPARPSSPSPRSRPPCCCASCATSGAPGCCA